MCRFDAPSPRQRPTPDRLQPPSPAPPLMTADCVLQSDNPCAEDIAPPPIPLFVQYSSGGLGWSLNRPRDFAHPGLREGPCVPMTTYELGNWSEPTPMNR